ncbi:hypothetical protein G9A89_021403 [Geosiphon pyriformis]|nr:hypothetical protein G9A89_021403 [Geosiphon pyriformis]
MPFSMHSHSGQFCTHAKGTLEEVVQEAIKKKFLVYGLSEHCPRHRLEDLYPEESHLKPSDLIKTFKDFVTEAKRLQTKYKSQIKLIIGFESETITLETMAAETLGLLKDHKLDYQVGSVHHVHEIPIDFDLAMTEQALVKAEEISITSNPNSRKFYFESREEALFDAYFDAQFKMLTETKPMIVGHFDVIRKFCKDWKITPRVWEKIVRNVEFVVAYDGLFEVNAAGWKSGLKSAYPQRDILRLIIGNGGKLTISDDSHGPAAVALNYDKLFEYLKEFQIHTIHYLDHDENGNFVIKELKDALEHPFCQKFFQKKFFTIQYDKSKPFFDYEATVGSVIAVMKKTIKVSGSESGFKAVASRKKRKGGVLTEGIDNRSVIAKTPGAHSWSFETGDTTESKSINMEEKCLVEETSVDYGENSAFAEGDPNQMPKGLHVMTKKVLGKLLGVIDYSTVDIDDNVLDDSFLFLSSLPIKLAMMAAGKLANDYGVVVNTDLKCPDNVHTNWDIVLKEILVGTSIEAVCAAKAIVKMEDQNQADLLANKWSILIGKDAVHVARADMDKQTWDSRNRFKALIYTLPVDFLDLVGEKTCVIDRNPVDYTCVHCAFVGFESKDVLLQAMANVPVIKDVRLCWSRLSTALCFSCNSLGHTSLVCKSDGVSLGSKSKRAPLSAQDQLRLAKIYEKKSASASVIGSHLLGTSHGYDSQLGSIGISKPLPPVVNNLEKQLVTIESSLVSLTERIGELTKRLDSFMPAVSQPSPEYQVGNVVMEEGLGEATCGKTAMLVDLFVSPQIIKLETMLEDLSAFVLSLSARFDGLKIATCNVRGMNNPVKQDDIVQWHKDMGNLISIFMKTKLRDKAHLWLTNKFDGVRVFSSGLNSGYVGAGVVIVLNSFLAKHVCRISEVSGYLLCVRLLFRNKLSVFVLGLYAGVSSAIRFAQAGEVNSLIAKTVNESSFVVLGGNFNKDGFHRCASFKKCFELGLVNSLCGSSFVKTPIWCNSCDVNKTIDYVFISSNLVGVVVDHGVAGVENFFDTDHRAVSVFVDLGGLFNVRLNSICKKAMAVNVHMYSDAFVVAEQFSDLDMMWNIVHKVVVLSAGRTFRKKWFKCFDSVFNKVSSRFYKLELFVSKLVKASYLVSGGDFAFLLDTWNKLDSVGASSVKSLFFAGSGFDAAHSELAKTRKFYCSAKLMESKHAEDSQIRQTIKRRIESFEVDKGHTIWNVLEKPFWKVVLDHLVVGEELVLEPELVKSKKRTVMSDISSDWKQQFQLLDHVFNDAFTDIMCSISFDEMFGVISSLPEGKAAGLFSIPNEFWKHCDKSVLDMLLVLLNFCLVTWVSMIPKPYEWKGVLTNTHPIALIETARKILSKILSDRISLACSAFNVFCRDNFSVLKSTSMQLSIFAVSFVIEDVLKKNWKLWLHLKRSLVRIKMCNRFIRFFGDIHNSHINKVMMDFGLTDDYCIHNGLDQSKVFSPLLWHIFYDLLFCKVKQQKSVCSYRLISHFVTRTDHVKFQGGLSLFLATGAFIDDTIWVGSSQAAMQYILDIASDFFRFNNISINNDKTVAIPINYRIANPVLTVSGSPISIAKKGVPHYYLGIFLFSDSLSKPSLAKAHLDVRFFVNLIFRKAILDKQFTYLVSLVLFLIVDYRTQFSFDTLIRKGLKFKSGLPLDFPNDALHYPSLYNLETFEQIQAKSKLASVIAFANSSHDLQVLSWHPCHSLLLPVYVRVSLLNNFLVGVVHILSGCDLSLGGSLASAFYLWSGTPMSLVLGEKIFFKCVPSIRHYNIAFVEQFCGWDGIEKNWISVALFPPGLFSLFAFLVMFTDLLVLVLFATVYGSLNGLGTIDMKAGAAVFFEAINLGLSVGVSGLVFSTLAELQAIALTLECVLSFRVVDLFLDSQMALDNLDVNWIKVKGHSSVLDNEHANALARDAAFFAWCLPHLVNKRFIKTGVDAVSGNSRHFVRDVFRSIHCTHWKVGSGFWVVPASLYVDIDWLRSSLVWHPDSHLALGFTSTRTIGFQTYFMKALHHWLPVAVQKHLYDRSYPSVVYLFCGDIEISDHIFFCPFETAGCARLLDDHTLAWEVHSGLVWSSLCVLQLLFTCVADAAVGTTLCKGFIFGGWFCKSVLVFKDSKIATSVIVDFVHAFCLSFWNNIWLVHAKHWAFMEKNRLIPHDDSVPVSVSGSTLLFSPGVVKLLGIAEVFGVGFEFYKFCLFFSGIGDVVSIHIGA